MGVIPGILYATDATGWTQFTPSGTPQNGYNTGPPAPGNTMVIFVSSSDPNRSDSPSATEGSSATPYATWAKGISRMRSGEADWCLGKKTDTFAESINLANNNTGKSATEPQVYGCYDPSNPMVVNPATGGARPIFHRGLDNSFGVNMGGGAGYYLGGNFIAFAGLVFHDHFRDPDNVAFDPTKINDNTVGITVPGNTENHWMRIEDCLFLYCNQGVAPSSLLFYTWRFTVSSSSTVSAGDIYSNNGALFYVTGTDGGLPGVLFAERLRSSGSASTTGGTLTKVSGNAGSSASITFTAARNPGFNSNLTGYRSSFFTNFTITGNAGASIHSNQVTSMAWLESCFDHGGWNYGTHIYFVISGTATASVGDVYNINDGTSVKAFTVSAGITGGTILTCTKNQVAPLNVLSGALSKVSGNAGSTATINFTMITDTVAGAYFFCHNLYHSQFADEYDNASYLDGVTHTGCIHSRDAGSGEQQRRGGIMTNGLFIANPMVQSGALSNDYTLNNCVVLEPDATPAVNSAQGIQCGAAAHYDRGNAIITNNIIAHGKLGTMGPAFAVDGSQNGLIDNNIVYDWPGGNVTGGIITGGIISYGAITAAGTGGPNSVTFTGFVDDGSGAGSPSGIAGNVLTITACTGTPIILQLQNQGQTSGGGPRITGTGLLADTYIAGQLSGTPGAVGTYNLVMDQRNTLPAGAVVVGAGTTFTINAYYVKMTANTGPNAGGGVARGWVTLNGSGGIATCVFFPTNAFLGWTPGIGYTVGDELTTSDIPGLTGFKVLVGSVRNTTVTGSNKFFATGITNLPGDKGFPDPGRNIERYDAEVLGGPGTFAHFISLAVANNKASWDSRLTANAVNNWIRVGFGISGSGGAVDTSPAVARFVYLEAEPA